MPKNVVIIHFSSRETGNCAAVSAYIACHHADEKVVRFVVDSGVVFACGNCDYECLRKEKSCPNLSKSYMEIMDAICNADLAYFVVPNYCGYPCANYFAFNERSAGYFNKDDELLRKYLAVPKRFIVVSNSEENFENALQQQVDGKPEILYMKTAKYRKLSIAGDMMESVEAKVDLKVFLDHVDLI